MKKTFVLLAFTAILFLQCRRETPQTQNCHITKVAIDGVPSVNLSYDAQGRPSAVGYINAPEFSFNITYSTNQKITLANADPSNYEKRIFLYNNQGNVIDIKTFYEDGSTIADEELKFTYNGNEVIADTAFESGTIIRTANYTWQNGNAIKIIINGNRIIHRGYDLTKPAGDGDAAWALNILENTGYQVASSNLLVYEYEEGAGNETTGAINYTFRTDGKISGVDMGASGQLTYTYDCN